MIIETPKPNISKVMHYINGSYTTFINKKRGRSGHLFQGRYKAILIDRDNYLLELSRYIHVNAVSDFFGVDNKEVLNDRKEYRNICIYIMKKYTGMTNSQIGQIFNGLTFSAVAKVYQRMSKTVVAIMISEDTMWKGTLTGLKQLIKDSLKAS